MAYKPKPTPFLPSLSSVRWKLHPKPLQPRTTGPCLPPATSQRAISLEKMDLGISHLSPSVLLLKVSSPRVQPRGGGSLLLSSTDLWDRGSTLGMALLRILGSQAWVPWLVQQGCMPRERWRDLGIYQAHSWKTMPRWKSRPNREFQNPPQRSWLYLQ